MKSVMLIAALCAALSVSAPVTAQAATAAKGPTDMQIYCTFLPLTSKCAPAKAAPAKAVAAKPVTVASVKPAAVKPAAKTGIKTMACVKAKPGAGHLYDCTWK